MATSWPKMVRFSKSKALTPSLDHARQFDMQHAWVLPVVPEKSHLNHFGHFY